MRQMTGFSTRLIALRGNKSLDTVAEAVSISTAALTAYEAGKRVPRDDVKLRLATFYEIPVSELFPAALTVEVANEVHDSLEKLDSEQISDVADLVRALSPDGVDVKSVMADAYRLARLRRIAKRNGAQIQKKFNRSFGGSGYMLVDTVGNFVVAGADPIPYSLTLDDVDGRVSVMEETEK